MGEMEVPLEPRLINDAINQQPILEDDLSVSQVADILREIQDIFEMKLSPIFLRETREGKRIKRETGGTYFFTDFDGSGWNLAIDELDIGGTLEEVVMAAHAKQIRVDTDLDIEAGKGFVVSKPGPWQEGQFTVEEDLAELVEYGLSSAEALDYWMTITRGKAQSRWAERCGKSKQAVNKNVKNAEVKLRRAQYPV